MPDAEMFFIVVNRQAEAGALRRDQLVFRRTEGRRLAIRAWVDRKRAEQYRAMTFKDAVKWSNPPRPRWRYF
ncbi:MAG: hypothetical protein HY548_00870 [Elusimicrobia bacterium]|nr:hypothetical protein [Elusimicrobiota bacterium]